VLFNCLLKKYRNPQIAKCNRTVTVKSTSNAEERVIYDAREVISGLQAPIVKNPEVKTMYFTCLCQFLLALISIKCDFCFVFLYEVKEEW